MLGRQELREAAGVTHNQGAMCAPILTTDESRRSDFVGEGAQRGCEVFQRACGDVHGIYHPLVHL